jgi:hypothetical protein
MRESSIWADEALGDPLGGFGAPDVQPVFPAGTLIPAAQQKTGVIGIVIKMMVSEEKIVNLRGEQSGLNQSVRGGWPTIKHQIILAHLQDVRGAKSRFGRSWSACTKQV